MASTAVQAPGGAVLVSPLDLAVSFPDAKTAEHVARALEQEIVEGGWRVGSVVASQAELLDRFGVSRAVFREAVRLMEHHGVARMRRGPGGGLLVTAPDGRSIAGAMALCLDFRQVTLDQLHEARITIELTCVEAAAQRIDAESGERLLKHLADENRTGLGDRTGVHDLHVLLAELSGNAALRFFGETLIRLAQRRQRQDPRSPEEQSAINATVHRAHSAIVDAVVAGDAALARHRLARHLDAIRPWLRPL